MRSSLVSMSVKRPSMPGSPVACTTLPTSCISRIASVKLALTASNMALSAGSCFRMSSEPRKMFSRYIHACCTFWMLSIISLTRLTVCSQKLIGFSNTM